MSDNIDVSPGRGGNVKSIATDNVDGVHYPVYKFALGADGVAEFVSVDNALPVTSSSTDVDRMYALKESIDNMVIELKINNAYNALAHNQTLTERDL